MSGWQTDKLVPGFEANQFEFPGDYDGPVVATLVRRPPARQARGVLYVHGFIDYFFQAHLAERFAAEGFAFYALDLRKHVRSLLQHQHPCFCKDLTEYFSDITRAIDIIGAETSGALLLAGHSTGGLVGALYAHSGERRSSVAALWLNSPFLDFNASPCGEIALSVAGIAGRFAPFLNTRATVSPFYGMSLHKDYRGEWDFDLRLKPIAGFPTYLGWIRAIRCAHTRIRQGLAIGCPVLSMHSDKSEGGAEWKETFLTSDLVLDVEDIKRWSPSLGDNVKLCEIRGGLHDLVLSRKDVRERVFSYLFTWLRDDTPLA